MTDQSVVMIEIMDKQYKLSCPQEERDALIKASHYLHEKMQQIKGNTGKIQTPERIAVLAALNITHELMNLKRQDQLAQQAERMHEKLDSVLTKNQELEI